MSNNDFPTIETPDGEIEIYEGVDGNWYLDAHEHEGYLAIVQLDQGAIGELIEQLRRVLSYQRKSQNEKEVK